VGGGKREEGVRGKREMGGEGKESKQGGEEEGKGRSRAKTSSQPLQGVF